MSRIGNYNEAIKDHKKKIKEELTFLNLFERMFRKYDCDLFIDQSGIPHVSTKERMIEIPHSLPCIKERIKEIKSK